MVRNYVIIGASSGIGEALSKSLQELGSNVFGTYNRNKVQNTERANYYKYNVLTDELPVSNFPEQIHGLAYCPGSINLKPFHRFTETDFLDDYKLQVVGATKVIKTLLPRLKQTPSTSIVLFSTIAVQQGFNFHAQVASSKGAIEGLTRALAAEFAPNIRVNAIAPSITDTPLASKFLSSPEKKEAQAKKNPLHKIGTAQEIAEAAAYLLSNKSSWTNGQVIHLDGGQSAIK